MQNQQRSVTARIMDFVTRHPGCLLEDVVLNCPDLTWNQVFLEVDRLSRDGQIRLLRRGSGLYSLHVPGYERGVARREA